MDDDELCPPWWPQFVWDVHFHKLPWNPGGPVNYPPEIDNIFLGLAQYSLTFRMADQKAASALRSQVQANLLSAVKALGQQHE